MTKKKLLEIIKKAHEMDDIKLFMTVLSISRVDAVADYLMQPNREDIAEELALYMGQMMGRLDSRMVQRQYLNSRKVEVFKDTNPK
jgi:hypothetical protein